MPAWRTVLTRIGDALWDVRHWTRDVVFRVVRRLGLPTRPPRPPRTPRYSGLRRDPEKEARRTLERPYFGIAPLATSRLSPVTRALQPVSRFRGAVRRLPMWLDALLALIIFVSALGAIVVIQQRSAHRYASTVAAGLPATDGAVALSFVDDAPGTDSAHFSYTGPWDHLSGQVDGRRDGTSSRSYQPGATASFTFSGTRLEIYGVRGPNGGTAFLHIDGVSMGTLDFYARHKETAATVYSNAMLNAGNHRVDIQVAPPTLTRGFVNIDGAAAAGG